MNAKSPSIAVITRTAGRSPVFLARALASIRAQTVLPAEILVFNVGADVRSVSEVVSRSGLAERIATSNHGPLSQPIAANRAVAETQAEWITFLDDDDTWDSIFIEQTAKAIEREAGAADFAGVATQTTIVRERFDRERVRERRREPFNPAFMAVDLAQLASANQFTNNALVFRRAAFTEVGGFREDLPLLYDWDFNVRLAVRFRIECLPMNLANYHLRAAQDGAPNSAQDEMLRAAAKIRNEWIRADLAAGRIGLGQLALAGEAVGVGRFLARMARWRMRLRHWLA